MPDVEYRNEQGAEESLGKQGCLQGWPINVSFCSREAPLLQVQPTGPLFQLHEALTAISGKITAGLRLCPAAGGPA